MGIRVYIRNTADENSENEICLGKLYAYAYGTEHFKSVEYMIEHQCFYPEYHEYLHEYHYDYYNLADQVECLLCAEHLEYGEFAVFTPGEIFEFLILFADDCNEFWKNKNNNYKYDVLSIMYEIMKQQQMYHNSVWEIRQGV